MPPESFLGRPVRERRKAGASQQLRYAQIPLARGLAEQPAEKLDILADAKVRIEVLAEALRHVGDARAYRGAMGFRAHVAAKHLRFARLDAPGPRDNGQQGGLADTVRADEACHDPGRNSERDIVEGRNPLIVMAEM